MRETPAAVFDGTPGAVSVRRFAVPEPRGGEVLVRVLGCTLCGSDLHTVAGRRTVAVPTVLGHEIVGEVAEFGPSAPHADWTGEPLRVGDRVTWAVVAACGRCFFCTHDLWPKCTAATKYGHEALAPGRELLGGLAGHVLLAEGTAVVKLPDEVPLEVACPANCATATVAAALDAAGELRGATVCVLGAGLLGLTACAMARDRGAAAVVAVDRSADRLTLAQRFGAHLSLTPDELDKVGNLTDGRGADVLIELTGSTAALEAAWPWVRVGGAIALVGSVFPGPPLAVFPEQVVRRSLTIRGVHNYSPRHLVEAVRFLAAAQGRYPFADLVSDWVSLADVAAAFKLAEDPARVRVGVRE